MTTAATPLTDLHQALDWLESEIQKRNIPAKVLREQAEELRREYHTFIGVPVRFQGVDLDAYEEAMLLTDMENAWNYQEPPPSKRLHLVPAGLPQGIW